MSIKDQPKLLLAIYALLGLLALIFAALLYINPLNLDATPAATRISTLLTQAELLRNKKQSADAEKLCLDALKISDSSTDDMQKAQVYHALGLTYFQSQKLDEADSCYRKALSYLDQQIDQEGKNRLTLENLRRAQNLHAQIEGDLADLLASESKYEEAEARYRSAIERNDQYLGSLELQRNFSNKLASVLVKAGKNGQADPLQVEAYASDYATKDLMAETKLIQEEFDEGKIDATKRRLQLKAIVLASQRKKRAVEYVDAQTDLAKALLEEGQPKEAQKELAVVFDFVKNGQFDHESESIWLGRARVIQAAIYLALHEDKEAQRVMDQAGKANPKLVLMSLLMHMKTANSRDVGLKNYADLMTNLAAMAHLEKFHKASLSQEDLTNLTMVAYQTGVDYSRMGKTTQAKRFLKLALDLAQGTNAWMQAEITTHLGRDEATQGQYAEAEKDYQRALSILPNVKPLNNLVYLSLSANYYELGDLYSKMHNETKAKEYFKKAYNNDIKHKNWTGILAYAQYLNSHGDYKAARPIYEQALANLKAQANPSKKYIQLMESKLQRFPVFASDKKVEALIAEGNKFLTDKNKTAARNSFQNAGTAAVEKFGKESFSTAQAYRDIADKFMEVSDFEDARPYYQLALEIFERDKKILLPRANYVNYCRCLSEEKDDSHKSANAEKITSMLLPITAEIEADPDSADRPILCLAQSLLGEAYSNQKMYKQAQDYYNRSVVSAEEHLRIDPREGTRAQLAESLRNQAVNYTKLKKFDVAIDSYKRAIAIWEKLKQTPDVVKKLNDARVLLKEAISQKDKPNT
ncbi:MAG: tetratricopeptide repeat protein [Candidatus Melainabacteria bacterium]|nr:MAG: tetratricopeptide repeat protein [Candidatus Melainabacteria bacterium]